MAFQAGRGKGFLKIVSLLPMSDFPSIRLQSANLPLLNIQNNFGFNQVISKADLRAMQRQMRVLLAHVSKSSKAVMSPFALILINYTEKDDTTGTFRSGSNIFHQSFFEVTLIDDNFSN